MTEPPLWRPAYDAAERRVTPHADRLVVTDVDVEVDGDTWAPVLDGAWTRTARTPESGWSESASGGLRYAVSEYERATVGGPVPDRGAR